MATLLVLARDGEEDDDSTSAEARAFDEDNDDLDDYKLWVAFKEQADILRKEVEGQKARSSQLTEWLKTAGPSAEALAQPAPRNNEHCQSCCKCSSRGSGKDSMRGNVRKDEILPELPWYYQKSRYINSAAIEMKL